MASASCDLAVVGGGPAGAAAALAAARAGIDVALLEGSRYDSPRPGETLAAAARPVLARLGLGAAADAASTPAHGTESAWGADELAARPSILDPYGDGHHLDRPRFDELLAGAAAGAGARVLCGTRVAACAPERDGWRLTLANGEPPRPLGAGAIVDATGREAVLARSLGAHRRVRDHLVGIAVEYRGARHEGGPTLVEAVRDGWWYAAPLPPDRVVAVLVTDADLCRAGRYADPVRWARALGATRHVGARVRRAAALGAPRVASAVSHRLERGRARGRWLASGDAALAVDPLSGSGLLRALLSGEAAGLAAAAWLRGQPQPAHDYERWLDARFEDYWRERDAQYALERRWPDAPFWRRRAR